MVEELVEKQHTATYPEMLPRCPIKCKFVQLVRLFSKERQKEEGSSKFTGPV